MPNPNSNNAILISSSAGPVGLPGWSGADGATGPAGEVGAQGATGAGAATKLDVVFTDAENAYKRVGISNDGVSIGSVIYPGTNITNGQPSRCAVVIRGYYAQVRLVLRESGGNELAVGSYVVNSDFTNVAIPIVDTFPTAYDVLTLEIIVKRQPGYDGNNSYADVAYLELT
jgi:hypothetical protein